MDLNYRFLTMLNTAEQERYRHYRQMHGRFGALLLSGICRSRIWLDWLEVPITTYCSLCCRHCANLIQYYTDRSHIPAEKVIQDLSGILDSVDGIRVLRILGGEPLLHPEFHRILEFCIERSKKIQQIEIVTNGTVLLPEAAVNVLQNNSIIKMNISDYGIHSFQMQSLVRQLDEMHISYEILRSEWKAKASLINRRRSERMNRELFRTCFKPFSLFNGELHICPRSSHGTDLQAVPRREEDYVRIDKYNGDTKALRKAVMRLMKVPYVEACNYCDGEGSDDPETVIPGEQCSHAEAQTRFQEMQTYGRDRNYHSGI